MGLFVENILQVTYNRLGIICNIENHVPLSHEKEAKGVPMLRGFCDRFHTFFTRFKIFQTRWELNTSCRLKDEQMSNTWRGMFKNENEMKYSVVFRCVIVPSVNLSV